MLVATVPAVTFVAGVLLYALAANPKLVEVGRALLWCGLVVLVFTLAGHVAKL